MRSAMLLGFFAFPALAASPVPFEPNIFVELAKKAVPSVVNISTLTNIKGGRAPRGTPEDLFRKFFDDFLRNQGRGGGSPPSEEEEENGAPQLRAMSLGTGFVIDPTGLILTNNHVVSDADEIKIQFTEEPDEKLTDGEVVGRDPDLDLALIRVKTKRELIPLRLGDSDSLEVGEYVIAVGNPFGQGHSVTHGIISAKGRLVPDFPFASYIQTDAPINPGNSGGPLMNLKGEVIGINNAIDQRAQGIGFAIPISLVKKVLTQLKSKGSVSRGYIGVLVNELTPELAAKLGAPKDLRAPFVTNAYPGEPADKAGIRAYDVIVEFNKKPIRNFSELITQVTSVEINAVVPVKVIRNGETKIFSLTVRERPGRKETIAKGKAPKKSETKADHISVGMSLEQLGEDTARELGLSGKPPQGVLVEDVEYGGPADRAGIVQGDLILEVDRQLIRDIQGFFRVVKAKKSYLVRIRRLDPQGREVFSVVVLDLT